jgi:hypothetical protein
LLIAGSRDSPTRVVKYLIAGLIFSAAALGFMVFEVGVGLRPFQVIKASLAQDPKEIGFWTYRQLRPTVFKLKILVWGYEDQKVHIETLRGFLETAKNDSAEFNVLIKVGSIETDLPLQTITVNDIGEISQIAGPLVQAGQKIVLLLPSAQSAHSVRDAFVHRLEQKLKLDTLAISNLDWRPAHPNYELVKEHCEELVKLTAMPDFQGLRCLYETRTKKLVKLKKDQRLGFMVDQYGQYDFVLLVYD